MNKDLFSLEEDIFVSDNSAVLLIEKDEMTKEITTGMLKYLGYTVETVRSTGEAVALYKLRKEEGHPFKVVICDICRTEGLDGREALRRILEYDPRVRAIASSGFTSDGTMVTPRAYGFHASLPRPYGIRQLGSALKAVINSGGKKERLTKIRKDVRHGIVARFQFVDGEKSGDVCEAVAINISKHGFGFLTEAVFTEGQAIRVTDHDLRNLVGCRARIMWVKKGLRYYQAGAKFVAPPDESQATFPFDR